MQGGLADAQVVDDLADLVLVGLGRELLFDHQAADEVDAEVQALHHRQPDREQAERERQPECPAAQADEVDVGVVGYDFQEAHEVSFRLKC